MSNLLDIIHISDIRTFIGYTGYKHTISKLLLDIQTMDIKTFIGTYKHWIRELHLIYKHWISQLLRDKQTLDVKTFIGHMNIAIRTLLDIQTLNITAFT